MVDRCPECGSWERECGSPTPVADCACNRCLRVRLANLEKRMEQAADEISPWMTGCDYRAEPYLQKAFRLLVGEDT